MWLTNNIPSINLNFLIYISLDTNNGLSYRPKKKSFDIRLREFVLIKYQNRFQNITIKIKKYYIIV